MANSLKFLKGTRDNFDALAEKINTSFYVVEDIDKVMNGEEEVDVVRYSLYLGSTLIADGVSKAVVDALELRIDALEGLVGSESVANQIAAEIKKIEDAYKAADEALQANIDGLKIKALDASEIAELQDNNVKEAYKLVNKDGNAVSESAVIKIYKDSALAEVVLTDEKPSEEEGEEPIKGQFLKFTYNLADGAESDVYVDVSTFLVQSEFGDGLVVSEAGVVSVKLAATSAENKNFLAMEEGALAVRSIDSKATVLQEKITVAGLDGQLGAGNYTNGMVISAGTSVYDILTNILCKNLYPTGVTRTSASASASMSALSLTLDKTGTVEVGTKVQLTKGSTNGTSASNVKNSSISGMEYGYSMDISGVTTSTDKIISATCTTGISNNNYVISATINSGFGADTVTNKKTTPTTVSGSGSASLAVTTLGCVEEGTNKITINASGATISYSADKIEGVYYMSNLGRIDEAHYAEAINAVSSATSRPTKTASGSVTGVYYYFMGGSQLQDPNNLDSATIRALGKSSTLTKDADTNVGSWTSPGYSVVIACPTKYKLSEIKDSMGNSYMGKFSKTATIGVQTGEITTQYTVYMYPLENNDKMSFTGIKFSKV